MVNSELEVLPSDIGIPTDKVAQHDVQDGQHDAALPLPKQIIGHYSEVRTSKSPFFFLSNTGRTNGHRQSNAAH